MNPTHVLLDRLADGIAALEADDARLMAASDVVVTLERLAGAALGVRERGLPGLARRFARAHRLLLDAEPTASLVAHLDRQVAALGDPSPAPAAEPDIMMDAAARDLTTCGSARGTLLDT